MRQMKNVLLFLSMVLLVVSCSVRAEQQNINENLQSSGFRDFQHYQQARIACMELLSKNPLIPNDFDCGMDTRCLQREADAFQSRYNKLVRSPVWRDNKCNVVIRVESGRSSGSRQDSYTVEASYNDELFIINGEKFEAKTYCFNMNEGDEVIFIEGSALGACASAIVVNLRTKRKCELWCE